MLVKYTYIYKVKNDNNNKNAHYKCGLILKRSRVRNVVEIFCTDCSKFSK